MDFFINEEQLKVILAEQDDSRMTNAMRALYSFTYNTVSRVVKKYGINVRMLLTWGTSVGGLMLPLDNFMKSGNFQIDNNQRALIIAGVASILYYENKALFTKIFKKIKEENLEEVFKSVLEKGEILKKTFIEFLSSMNRGLSSFLDIVGYAFLIPILTDIHYLAIESKSLNETALIISERIVASGVVVLSAELISRLIKKILERFK